MSQLEKLSIQGVRSFNPEKPQLIKFCPLTLILGVNGAGKTTIIEALRYVASGEAPPGTDKGKTWIHDPRMQKSGKIRAQVKLQFKAKDDVSFTATRSIEMVTRMVQNGKVSTSMKTLDMMIKRGDRQDAILSSKHGETGLEMLSLMGVSKAVLTNVIFCHQEDNCWPLSEGKVLKEKFDQIFGSVGYVKSLDKIKKYRADKVKEVNTLKAVREMHKEVKDAKIKYEQDIDRLKKDLDSQKKLRAEFETKLRPIKVDQQALAQEETLLMKVRTKISKINGALSEKVKMKSRLEKQISEKFDGTLEDLTLQIEDFLDSLGRKQDKQKEAADELKTNNSLIKNCNAMLQPILGKIGRLEQQQEMIAKSVASRDEFLNKINNEYKFCEEVSVYDVVEGLKKILSEIKKDAANDSIEIDDKIRRIENEIDDLKLKRAKDSQTIKLKRETQSVREKEVEQLLDKLRGVESSANEVMTHSVEIESISKRLKETLTEMSEMSELQTKVSQLKISNTSLENSITDFKLTYNEIIRDLASNVADLEKSVAEYDVQIPRLQSELASQRTALKKLQNENRAKEDKCKEQMRKLDNLNNQVTSNSATGDKISFESLKAEMKELESKLDEANERVPTLTEKERRLEKECSEQRTVIRDFEDNKSLLVVTKEIEELEATICEEEKQLSSKDFDSLQRRKNELEGKAKSLEAQISACKGREGHIIEEISRNEREIRSKKYKEADDQYKKATIDYVTADMACNDLNTYYRVLDQAVSTFHVRRMADVNNQICHFWRTTYQGSDIDKIKIVCDDTEGTTADKRKQYNYKVVMVKDGLEMDMRGRCSAGQKVLASLVIRIALAQVFASDCAILTLDEPTTNLDKHNSEALSKAISGIVDEVKGKLQLVIITHDPDFLNYLNEEYSEFYYSISKEDGYSTIERKNVSDLK